MKTLITSLFLTLGMMLSIHAQDKTTIEAASADISDNLDLEAVASLFAEVEDLEDFEQQLNDPESRYSNLDLNQDGYVDYLRVLEKKKGNVHSITIQAVIGKDQYQDVAFIDVEKDRSGKTRVQVVGDVYMYGPDYIIEPVYVRTPIIFTWFWGPRWSVWTSPWYWGYYPPRWSVWRPFSWRAYHAHIRPFVHVHHTYHYVPYRRSGVCKDLSRAVSRKDLAKDRPEHAFTARNKEVKNKYELDNKRGTQSLAKPMPAADTRTTGKEIKSDWKPQSERGTKPNDVKDTKQEKAESRSTKTDTPRPTDSQAKPRSSKEDSATPRDSQKPRDNEAKPVPSTEQRGTKTDYSKPRKEEKPRATPEYTEPRKRDKPRSSTRSSSPKPRTVKKPTRTRSNTKPKSPAPAPKPKSSEKSRSSRGGR